MTWKTLLACTAATGVLVFSTPADAQFGCPSGPAPENWSAPYPPHRIIGPVYSVGSAELSVFLVATSDGHILVNTGIADSAAWIRDNVESLGFRFDDIRILLTMQAHYDHAAALADIKALTGAEVWATTGDTPILESGGVDDPHLGRCEAFRFAPVDVDRQLTDGSVIELGDVELRVLDHAGHTMGSSSYVMSVEEGGRTYQVAMVNMASINPGKRLLVDPTYEGIADDFAATFRSQKALKVDIWLAAHASQYARGRKHSRGQAYSPGSFVDPEGYRLKIARYESSFREQLQREMATARDRGRLE